MTSPDEDGAPLDKRDWTASDYAVHALCRTVGCGSLLGRPWAWGYRLVCNPLCLWLFDREEKREAAAP